MNFGKSFSSYLLIGFNGRGMNKITAKLFIKQKII